MGLSIKNPEVERLVRKVAKERGMTLTQAIAYAMRRIEQKPEGLSEAEKKKRIKAIRKIQAKVAAKPIKDNRSIDEIIGYDEFGLPT